eukprot:CAMPEP_0206142088 /NCGR_PEP_ID=MMETSP1473-20131121/15486_1 /ASSEMBLY_ACC=CAM_ASM_001109 /TAXON_ID=1461547 /ORGANISM="Stichococcus sp, Strain RCC1054" /LENGTH=627 /DNA_ID=CAMNT_0053536937 /DNA_START=255 /DNA_END=2138 /DNA_ORIENTATION=-
MAGWNRSGVRPASAGHNGINYSSKLERFASAHWSSVKCCPEREADVEAAADEPLLGSQSDEHEQPRSVLGFPMVMPHSLPADVLNAVTMVVDLTYTAFLVPISIAFNTQLSSWNWLAICDLLAGAVFTAAIIGRLHTGVVVRYNLQRKVVMDGRTVARMYLFHGSMIFDIASALPSWIEAVSFVNSRGAPGGLLLRVLLAVRGLRLVRLTLFMQAEFVANFVGNLGRRVLSWQLPLQFLYGADIIFLGLVLTNLLGMIWLFTAQSEGLENSWLTNVGGQDLAVDGSPVDIYFASVLFAMTTMSTTGYGDIHAVTTLERAVALVVMLIGVLFFGYVISSLSRLIEMCSPEARRAVIFRDKINKVDAWMSYRQLPGKLRSDITGYYANSWVPQSEIAEAALFEELPAFLRGAVASHLLRDILPSLELWQAMPEQERWRLAALLHPQQLLPGHDLCQEGEEATSMWLLQEGELLAIRRAVHWERLPAPALVGEEALHEKRSTTRVCTFRAVGGCTLWRLSMAEVAPLLKVFPDMVTSMRTAPPAPSDSRGRGRGVLRSLTLEAIRSRVSGTESDHGPSYSPTCRPSGGGGTSELRIPGSIVEGQQYPRGNSPSVESPSELPEHTSSAPSG